ncbi:MAG: Gfo/Idh/MocA family oxidoreductase [Spirochaetaceae bacterium]|nr:MAG: Gfo/Idh/MocA family oxidoreductase [Spirochaetaceae bacterium]
MNELKVGVIGIGFIGAAHVEALRRIPGIEVTAIAHSSDQKAKAKGQELGVDRTFGDYRRLLEIKEIHAVHVCTPNHLHYPQTRDALAAGKHVLCEKPLAVTVKEARDLVKRADASGLVTAVHFNIRFYPLLSHIRAMIAGGELGEIYAVHGSYLQDWLFYDTDYNWRLEPEYSGESRAIADIGSHWMDLIEFLTGERIAEVCADFATVHKIRKKPLKPVETFAGKLLKPEDYKEIPIGTEDFATVMLRFKKGARGVFSVSQISAGRKNRLYFEIDGSKRSVAWDSELPSQLWIGRRDGPNELLLRDPSLVHAESRELIDFPGGHNEGFPDTSKQLFKRFYAAVRAGGPGEKPGYPSFGDGLRELELCETILQSNKRRTWLPVGA